MNPCLPQRGKVVQHGFAGRQAALNNKPRLFSSMCRVQRHKIRVLGSNKSANTASESNVEARHFLKHALKQHPFLQEHAYV